VLLKGAKEGDVRFRRGLFRKIKDGLTTQGSVIQTIARETLTDK